MLPQMRFYETWGRDIEVKFHDIAGDDEAAQRADLVAVKAMKPFAWCIHAGRQGLFDVPRDGVAQAKIPVMGFAQRRKDEPAGAVPLGLRATPRRPRSTPPRSSASNSSARRRSTAATT